MSRFLGFDCAHKTLAWTYCEIDLEIGAKLAAFAAELRAYVGADAAAAPWDDPAFIAGLKNIIAAIRHALTNFINFLSVGVCDILDGEKLAAVGEINRTKALHRFLTSHQDIGAPSVEAVLIEHQPVRIGRSFGAATTNSASSAVSHQLAYHYVSYNPIFVDPKLKNKICFAPQLKYELFLEREMAKLEGKKNPRPEAARYAARKKHSKANMLHFLTVFGRLDVIAGISRAVLDDLADSFMEILAWLVGQRLL